MSYVIGVDVGGTNTDAVILQGKDVVSSFKHPTTPDPIHGIINAITGSLRNFKGNSDDLKSNICRVCIGTTHFVNAVVERRKDSLTPVAVIRLCGPASTAVPPFADFPQDLKRLMNGRVHMVSGGLEYNCKEISNLNQEEIKRVAEDLLSSQPPLKHVVISGVFSPLDDPSRNQEKMAADLLFSCCKDFSLTQASWIGRLGMIERENAAILNESLKPLASRTIIAFQKALKDLNFMCPLYLTQNDGTLISVEEAMQNPILTFSSGPTNSMRGAMFLSGRTDALVIDVGGTTTDIGVLCNGFPREASSQVKIGGVRTKFQMPDVVSFGLGGGSKVLTFEDGTVEVGPESVGYQLTTKAQCFGGEVLTATDIAIAAGLANGKEFPASKSVTASSEVTYKAMREMRNKVETMIDVVKTEKKDVPVLLVGGGAVLIDTSIPLKGASCLIFPPHYQVANAVGAALGTVAGRSERIESLKEVVETIKEEFKSLSEEELRAKARDLVIQKGIDNATEAARKKGCVIGSEVLHEKNVLGVTYVPDALKVSIKVIGQLTEESGKPTERSSDDNSKKPSNTGVIEHSEPVKLVKDNPYWPYSSEEDKKKDESAGLTPPIIKETTGEWLLTTSDIECICVGAGILGCSGGGDPNLGRINACLLQEQGKEIKIMNPFRVKKDSFGLAVAVAFMGAPVVIEEKLCNGTESEQCLKVIQNILATGICEESYDYGRKETKDIKLTTRVVSSGNKIWLPDVSQLPKTDLNSDKLPLSRRISGLICAEIGGLNSIEPLVTAAKIGLPVLDADGMGRAFPELQMFLPFINGVKAYPSCVADEKGNVLAVTHVETAKDLEEFFRTECVRLGMSCAVGLAPMSLEEILDKCVLHSFSQAWQLGRAIMRTKVLGDTSVTDAVLKQQNGILLLTGKVLDVDRDTSKGFTRSTVIVEGLGKFAGQTIMVSVKNENLVAHKMDANGEKGEILAVTPDLICIIDSDSGYPITTEDICYGLRVAVLALPAYPGLTTPQALEVVGPKGFGYEDIEYSPIIFNNH